MCKYDLRPATRAEILPLFEQYHGYKSVGASLTYAFAVFEDGRPVAAFVWQPPMVGAARAVCPEVPSAVLALSRMVAVPRDQRNLRHISKPLRRQMRQLIDRGRWPVLITYSDASLGHTGHVYKCSGWQRTVTNRRTFYVDESGRRRSRYANGARNVNLRVGGNTLLTRWEHWACPKDTVEAHMQNAGWARRATGKVWKSGNPRYRWVRCKRVV